jgi:DNA helicase HerA-like ATPase
MEHIGIIYGNVGTTEFECQTSAEVEKNDYIMVNHQTVGPVLGQVDTITRKTDLSLDKAQKIAEGQPVEIDEKITAKISVIGFRDDRNLLQVPRTPFKAGEYIYKAEDSLIRKVVGLKEDKETGAYVGLLSGHDIKIYIDINTLVQKHMSVLAKTGGGKSYVTGVILEELMKHNVTTCILDPHGEYASMREAQEFATDTKLNKDAKPLKFTLSNMNARAILELTNTKNIKNFLPPLRKAIHILRVNKGDYEVMDIIRILETDEDNSLGALINELEYLREVDIFAEMGTRMEELIKKGKTTIINLKGSPPDIQALVVNRICTYLFELRKQDKIPPLMIVAEEAHNFCPQQGTVASSKIFRTVASEGRKFGLGICIVTQRPAKVDKNVLSQCNTQVILKVTNPNDLKAITASVEGLTSGMTDEIQRIPIGTAIITGGKITMPLFVDIRPRESRHGGESVTIVEKSSEKGLA